MTAIDIIRRKRDGGILSEKEIRYFIEGYVKGSIPDYQASALLMAIYYKGMNDRETAALTDAMAYSGDTVDLSQFGDYSVDKHSTGGVGDKTTLIVAPIVAALGGKVAKMSGKGLGHTGGTVDKLDSIDGYRTELSPNEFMKQVESIGIAVIGQSGNLAPADKKMYALRDVTATIDSIPLIASSIMSKKIAAGSKSIVLDVKVGSGAFMKTVAEAEALARKMVAIGNSCQRRITALITNMDIPLGYAVGNTLEVSEAVSVLKNEGCRDLKAICVALSANMLSLCHNMSYEECERQVIKALENKSAYKKFKEWISAQGGNPDMIESSPGRPKKILLSPVSGYISHMDAEKIGGVSVMLGAGRAKKDDSIDYSAGILLKHKTGDFVEVGQELAFFYTERENALKSAEEAFLSAVSYSDERPVAMPLIYKTITGNA